MKTETGFNVAPSSTEGHFVKKTNKVINLDDVTESYFVEGPNEMVTKNHTTLNTEEDCLITCQVVYNPFSKMLEKSKD